MTRQTIKKIVTPNGDSIVDEANDALRVNVVASSASGGDGAILDGVSGSIKATVADLANSNPLTVAIVDGAGTQITSFGGGTQYTEADTDASITGTAMLWEDAADTLRAVSAAKPLPISAATLPLPTNAATSALQTQPGVDIGDVTINNAAGAAAVNIQDGGNVITVDGTVAVSNATFPVTDNAGSLTVDAPVATPVFVRLSDGAAAITTLPVSNTNLDVALSTRLKPADTLTAVTSLTQFNGQAIALNTGTRSAGTLRVTNATDDTYDVSDRAAREVGRVRLWDGTDEMTLLPLRTVPGTEKLVPTFEIPNRLPTYGCTTTTVTPAITIGVKELLAIWHASSSTKDKYIVEITATGLVVTASTATGRSALRVSTITSAPTGGTELTKVDISGAGASDMTNTMQVKTGGGAIGSTFIRKLTEFATSPIGRIEVPLFQASNPGNGIQLRAGSGVGISIDLERETAHTTLVDVWQVAVRWIEL
jgi:hypothetical protein